MFMNLVQEIEIYTLTSSEEYIKLKLQETYLCYLMDSEF